jgi:hypothetical protein
MRWALVVLAAAGVVGLVAVVLVSGGEAPATAGGGADVRVSQGDAPGTRQNETTVAACGGTLVAAWNDISDDDTGVGFARSTDGGVTWDDRGVVADPPGQQSVFDPVVTADSDCNFFLITSSNNNTGGPNAIWSYKSTDGGTSFGAPVMVGASGTTEVFDDKPWAAVDTSGGPNDGNLYVCWGQYSPGFVDVRLARSTNGGASFLPSVSIENPEQLGVNMCQVAVGPNGEVYVAWVAAAPYSVRIRRSDDGGQTFGPARTAAVAETPGRLEKCLWLVKNGSVRVPSTIMLAVDPGDGDLYVVWTDGRGDHGDVMIARSHDRGGHWSQPLRVNDDSTDNDQFLPAVAVDANGVVQVMWYDRRLDASNLLIDVYAAQSLDGGKTFGANERVTDVSFGLTPNINPYFDCYMGDYNSVVASGGTFHLVWGDNRNVDGDGQPDADVYGDAIGAPAPPPQPTPAVTPTPVATPGGPAVHDTAVTNLGAADEGPLEFPPGDVTIPVAMTVENLGNHPEGDPAKSGDGVLAVLTMFGLPSECVPNPGFNYFNIIDSEVADLAPGAESTMMRAVNVRCNDDVPSGSYPLLWVAFASSQAHGDTPISSEDADPENNVMAESSVLRVFSDAIPYGDGNCNGATNSIDAALVLQFAAALLDFLDCAVSADVNEDGLVNAIDAALILQFNAGLLEELPV